MKNLCKALAFLAVFAMLFTWLDNRFYDHVSGWEATDDWSQEFDIVFMGNSHTFCSINPVIINDALGLNTIHLGSPSQPIELTYYNLKTLLSKTTPKALVIGANTLNSSVENLYATEKCGNLYNCLDGIRNPFQRADAILHVIPASNWLEAYSQLFRPTNTWERFSNWNSDYQPYEILGYVTRGTIMSKTVDLKAIEQKYIATAGTHSKSNPADLTYMEKILSLAQEKNIPVYIIKCPIAFYSSINVDLMYDLNRLAEKYSVVKDVHDYNLETTAIGLTSEDFRDDQHLNNLGAVKFTEYLIGEISSRLEIIPDYTRVGWFRGEHYEALSDGMYRYTVDLYDGCLIRFIAQDGNGEIITTTEFSKDNSIELPLVGRKCYLFYELKADNPYSYTYDHPQKLNYILAPSPLKSFNKNDIQIEQDGNKLTLSNTFEAVPVNYAWYIFKDDEKIATWHYSEANKTVSYTFTEPGNYRLQAYVQLLDDSDRYSTWVAEITVDKDGMSWK